AHEVEAFHDSVRRWVAGRSPDDVRKAWHFRLVEVFKGNADPERLALHAEAAGLTEEAADAYSRAAARALAGLAFERAVELYRRARGWRPAGPGLLAGLADALAQAGRGAEAARAFLEAAAADEGRAFELRRRAAGLFLTSGHIDEGRAALADVLADAGLDFP